MYLVPYKSEGKIILYSTFFKEQGYGKQEQLCEGWIFNNFMECYGDFDMYRAVWLGCGYHGPYRWARFTQKAK